MLFKSLDKLKRTAIMTTIVLMFIGNILLFLPEPLIPFLGQAIGFVLLVVLTVSVMRFLASKRALIHYIYLSIGFIAGLIGIALFTFDGLLLQMLSWIVGILPILGGFYGIYHALVFARRSGRKGWWILIILSLALSVFGGFVFWNPWMESTQAVLQVIGGTMMYSALVSAMRLIWIWPIHKEKQGGAQE